MINFLHKLPADYPANINEKIKVISITIIAFRYIMTTQAVSPSKSAASLKISAINPVEQNFTFESQQ